MLHAQKPERPHQGDAGPDAPPPQHPHGTPPGQDPNWTPPGQGGTPPGQDKPQPEPQQD